MTTPINDGGQPAFPELRNMLREMDELSYEMLGHAASSRLCGLIERLQKWACAASSHDFQYDQCGYWQHQYCIECGESKYPHFAKQTCRELTAQMGKITEEEFAQRNSEVKGRVG